MHTPQKLLCLENPSSSKENCRVARGPRWLVGVRLVRATVGQHVDSPLLVSLLLTGRNLVHQLRNEPVLLAKLVQVCSDVLVTTWLLGYTQQQCTSKSIRIQGQG